MVRAPSASREPHLSFPPQANARVDLSCPSNDIHRYPRSTYAPLERGLARLEALAGVSPLCLAPGAEGAEAAAKLYA